MSRSSYPHACSALVWTLETVGECDRMLPIHRAFVLDPASASVLTRFQLFTISNTRHMASSSKGDQADEPPAKRLHSAESWQFGQRQPDGGFARGVQAEYAMFDQYWQTSDANPPDSLQPFPDSDPFDPLNVGQIVFAPPLPAPAWSPNGPDAPMTNLLSASETNSAIDQFQRPAAAGDTVVATQDSEVDSPNSPHVSLPSVPDTLRGESPDTVDRGVDYLMWSFEDTYSASATDDDPHPLDLMDPSLPLPRVVLLPPGMRRPPQRGTRQNSDPIVA